MSYRFYDYCCPDCGDTTEHFEDREAPPETQPCQSTDCMGEASRIFSAPKIGTSWAGSVSTGKSDERPHSGIMDTRALADGMPVKEWKAKRSKMWRDKDIAENKRELG